MKIRFSVHYQTVWGQELRLVGAAPALGEWAVEAAPAMQYGDGGTWTLEISLSKEQAARLAYKYCVVHAGGHVEWEWGGNRQLPGDLASMPALEVRDCWRPRGDPRNALDTAAFSRAVLSRRRRPAQNARPVPPPSSSLRCRFRVHAPRVAPDQAICLLGSAPALGAWDEARAIVLNDAAFPDWEIELDGDALSFPLRYKYGLYDTGARRVLQWEAGDDRMLWPERAPRRKRQVLCNDGRFRDSDPLWRGAGVAIPVFALRSRRGLGVGEFADIKRLVDWVARTGLKLIQILPVNDTVAAHTWLDSYPYAAISVFALHPIYMNLEDMGLLDAAAARDFIEPRRAALNALDTVDYEAVMAAKSRYYKMAYDARGLDVLRREDFQRFFERMRDWLVPYAVFSCLRDRFGTADSRLWPEYREMAQAEIERFASPDAAHHADVAVHYFIQYFLYRQLEDAADYARAHGVALKGDIPIGVYRNSVDTWQYPAKFNMDGQAGAPPDDFAEEGQNWRFPTYNWETMAHDGFDWWRRRLTTLSTCFDAFRIDHILGFFRIWDIPRDQVQGILGRFNPALPLEAHEISAYGIAFDEKRLCHPYIRPHLLGDLFGDDRHWVVSTFLDEDPWGAYRLKPAFDSQRKIEAFLDANIAEHPAGRERLERVRAPLYALVAEVLFLPDVHDPRRYHPRAALHRTHSYRELNAETRVRLDALYIDFFYRRHETFWRAKAMERLPAIRSATDMLICGEDLGMVPDCVSGVMDELGILSLFIQRMPKNPRQEFFHPADCPYLSVCSPSSHDMSPLRGWWEEDRAATQRFFNTILGHGGLAPYFCEDWVCREIVTQHLHAPAMWAIFPLQDLLGMDAGLRREDVQAERINVPSDPRHYWRYRMHLDLETLLQAGDFNAGLRRMVAEAGRDSVR